MCSTINRYNGNVNYLLKAVNESLALLVGEGVSAASEVRGEEIAESRGLGLGDLIIGVLAWEHGHEEHRGHDGEPLEIGVEQLSCGVRPTSLEGVAGNEGRMGVIWKK